MIKESIFILITGMSLFSGVTAAVKPEDKDRLTITISRYTRVLAEPSQDQQYPLAERLSLHFTQQKTVADALHHALQGSGYQMIHAQDQAAKELLNKPLPRVHRQLGPMTLSQILQVLVGQPFQLMVNDVRREICVALKSPYQQPDTQKNLHHRSSRLIGYAHY